MKNENWTIDLDAATATHENGLIVKFTTVTNEASAWDGVAIAPPPKAIWQAQTATEIARLMREAGDAWVARTKTNPPAENAPNN